MRNAIRFDVIRNRHLRVIEERRIADDGRGNVLPLDCSIVRAIPNAVQRQDKGEDLVRKYFRQRCR